MTATPINNDQPYLSLTELIMLEGIFPGQQDGSPGDGSYTLGMMRLFAGNFAWTSTAMSNGQLLQIIQHTALFSLLGSGYGGNAQTNFGLPDLGGEMTIGVGQGTGLDAIAWGEHVGADTFTLTPPQLPPSSGGTSQDVENHQPSQALQYLVRDDGIADSGILPGGIVRFAGNYVPRGFLAADGQELLVSGHQALFDAYGYLYGGNGTTTFRVPDLRGRVVVGASTDHPIGSTFGDEDISLTQANLPASMGGSAVPIDNSQPSMALTYIIATEGIFPSQSGGGGGGDGIEPFLGEIQIWGGAASDIPNGWVIAQGQILPINQHFALFSLLGTTYGGNGASTFALPDLRGRAPMGFDTEHPLGSTGGTYTETIDAADIPDLIFIGADDTNSGDAVIERSDGAAAGNVLANDGDPNSGPGYTKTVTGVRAGTEAAGGALGALAAIKGIYGTLTLAADGSYAYVLDNADADTKALAAGQIAADVFTYGVADNAGLSDVAQLTISVTGANAAPVVTSNGGGDSAAITVLENATAATNVAATDLDDNAVSYAIAGGADAGRFAIDGATGALTLIAAPDREAPTDAGRNNVYDVVVRASDGTAFDDQALAITIGNVAGNTIIGTAGAEKINAVRTIAGLGATDEEDMIDGKRGNDTLLGGLGNDTLRGGAGHDSFKFNTHPGRGNVDTIVDFKHNIDALRLEGDIFAHIAGSLSRDEFYARDGATKAHDHDDRIIYNSRSGKLFYDEDGKGGHAAVHFATLANTPVLDNGDFDIV